MLCYVLYISSSPTFLLIKKVTKQPPNPWIQHRFTLRQKAQAPIKLIYLFIAPYPSYPLCDHLLTFNAKAE